MSYTYEEFLNLTKNLKFDEYESAANDKRTFIEDYDLELSFGENIEELLSWEYGVLIGETPSLDSLNFFGALDTTSRRDRYFGKIVDDTGYIIAWYILED